MSTIEQQDTREKVRAGYAAIAEAGISPRREATAQSCCGPTSCCGADAPDAAEALAVAIGYDATELATLPEGANMGLSCGNPTALAALKPGEVVVDLGSGGGFDVFIAARRVGPHGTAIGVDMTPEMLAKARRNAVTFSEKTGLHNVEFRLGEIEHLPLADNSVDAIISNCVINLSPDKPQVWREIARVLKPGGRVAVSDLALVQPLPAKVATMVEALVGCVSGAALIDDTEAMVRAAGLGDISLVRKGGYVDAMTQWNDPLYAKVIEELPAGAKASDYITSLEISAVKPARKACCG
ncbi:arsenite methyltransferase [bacterium]|nr:arsenite methyltransferase [bacterium]